MTSALLLAAGRGTRLDPLTRLVAKPAVPMGDRTLVEHVVDWLVAQRVTDLVVNLHHLPETITAVLGDGSQYGLPIRYSWERDILGSAGGPRRALPLIDSDPFVIVNGDTLSDVELQPMIEAHQARGAAVTLALVPNQHTAHYNGVLLDDDDAVVDFIPRGHSEPSWHFVGIQVVSRRVFAALEDGLPAESVAGVYRDLLAAEPGAIRGWRVTDTFVDVGTPRDYLAAALRQPGGGLAGSVAVPESATLTRCAVWPGVVIGDNVRLEDCIVAAPLSVPDALEARSAILMPATAALPDDRMRVQGEVAIYSIDLPSARA